MHLRSLLAIIAGKTASVLVRLAGSGGGALPGLVSQRIDPGLLGKLSRQFPEGVTLICGTNGKTTTSRMVARILEEAGHRLVYNRGGSNMTRGHLAAFLDASSWSGRLRGDQVLLEVDEAVLPETLRLTKPRYLVLHNLFRDQLDRYGEVDAIARKWAAAIRAYLPPESTLLVNADDPNLAYLAQSCGHAKTVFYGLNDPAVGTKEATSTVDAFLSPLSGKPLRYLRYYLSHLGEYADPASGFARPKLDRQATDIRLDTANQRSSFSLDTERYELPLPGLYNVYNALAAASLARQLSISPKAIRASLAALQGAFGRFQRVRVGERELILCLIKNPAGASEVLRTLADEPRLSLAIFANDRFADGQDVSWYWDTGMETAAPALQWCLCSGSRASDMALRLKYARPAIPATVLPDPEEAFSYLLERAPLGRTYLLSTYTATLALQHILTRRGITSADWKL